MPQDHVRFFVLAAQKQTVDHGEPGQKWPWSIRFNICSACAAVVDIFFSSCGGTSDTSGQLAAHWAELWYGKEKSKIDADIFVPFGFLPTDSSCTYISAADIEMPFDHFDDALSMP